MEFDLEDELGMNFLILNFRVCFDLILIIGSSIYFLEVRGKEVVIKLIKYIDGVVL